MERKIKSQTAIYTGGGIYCYYGELEDGNYFMADDIYECARILNANPLEETGEEYFPFVVDDVEWQEKHLVEDFEDWKFIKQLFIKLINDGCNFTEHHNWSKGDIEDKYKSLREKYKLDLEVTDKKYYGADAIYISSKTNEIYTAYHFADCQYLIMREREYDNGGSSVINWFYNENDDLYKVLKDYVDTFESMDWVEFMKLYNHIN